MKCRQAVYFFFADKTKQFIFKDSCRFVTLLWHSDGDKVIDEMMTD